LSHYRTLIGFFNITAGRDNPSQANFTLVFFFLLDGLARKAPCWTTGEGRSIFLVGGAPTVSCNGLAFIVNNTGLGIMQTLDIGMFNSP